MGLSIAIILMEILIIEPNVKQWFFSNKSKSV